MRLAQMLTCLTITTFSSPIHLAAVDALPSLSQQSSAQSQPAHNPTFKDFDRKPVTISEEEFEALRGRVMSRCHLAAGTDPAKAPWYFHYEMGLELEKRGDPQRALDELIEATNRRPEPRRIVRMYGMWFTGYRPYFEIAKMHFALGNWQCAADALKISIGEREVTEGDKEYIELEELRSELEARSNH